MNDDVIAAVWGLRPSKTALPQDFSCVHPPQTGGRSFPTFHRRRHKRDTIMVAEARRGETGRVEQRGDAQQSTRTAPPRDREFSCRLQIGSRSCGSIKLWTDCSVVDFRRSRCARKESHLDCVRAEVVRIPSAE